MHEDVFAGLRGDEAVALVGVEPFHGSNSHLLVPPSTVLEVSTNADPTLVPTARDKLDLRVARQNVNLCRAHTNGYGHCLPQPGVRACRPSKTMAVHASCLSGSHRGRWLAKLQVRGQQRQTGQPP